MDCANALKILCAHESDLRRRGVRHAGLFGSTARGEAGPDSDVDLLIEIDEDRVRDVYAYVAVCSSSKACIRGRSMSPTARP
ncbi:nucleotidyltransferase family protein [Methylobacterium radiodurans]|uniref:nucleotidyltransferase family protein n=1 Tax=Methylobacterium radiodurans TaxID=2202828 RepID=UPI001FE40378|nr:nucleotidyltransferase domain-containing protein [Methylobacterium radiodurans]